MRKLWKKLAVGVAICMLTITTAAAPVRAAVENGTSYAIESNSIANWPQMGDMYSEAAVLMDADTGAVLVNKGMYEARYPASITKIMTTLLALENSNLTDEVTFTEEGLARMVEGTNIESQLGEVFTMEQALNIVMMVSANEVAAQVAIEIAGSESAFAEMMNQRAAQLGCKNTHFNNASGLPDENHYTCAYDMALIFREALKNEDFRKIIERKIYTLPATNKHPEARAYSTHLALVAESAPEYYADCIGGKTGVTQVALNTLVTAASRDGKTLIAVTLRADAGQVCADSTAMYEYGFNNFTKLEFDGGSAMVPNGVSEADLHTTNEKRDGVLLNHYYYGDKYVGTAEVRVPEETEALQDEKNPEEEVQTGKEESAPSQFTNPMLEHKGFAVTVGVLGGLIVLGILSIFITLLTRRR